MQHSELSGACRRPPGTSPSECQHNVELSGSFLGSDIYRCGCGNTLAVQDGGDGLVLVNDYPDAEVFVTSAQTVPFPVPELFLARPSDAVAKELRALAAHYRRGVGQPGYDVIADHLDDIAGELQLS